MRGTGDTRTPQGAKLSVSHVSKSFATSSGDVIDAVVDVSFDVAENELCALLGPSGCGKSTVLRMVAGLEEPTDGSLMLDGHEITGPGGDRGMVFQTYTSFDWLTVQQNVEYGMRLNGVSKGERRERANHYIELVQLEKFRNAFPSQLSGGMKQRVAIARTLANDPAILLMDEPFGALDALTREEMSLELLRIWQEQPKTIFFVTHSVPEAVLLADRVCVMTARPGRITEIIDVPLARPRSYEQESLQEFQNCAKRIRQHIFGDASASARTGAA